MAKVPQQPGEAVSRVRVVVFEHHGGLRMLGVARISRQWTSPHALPRPCLWVLTASKREYAVGSAGPVVNDAQIVE